MTESFTDKLLISLRYSFAALNASLLTHILHPFDVVKIRFQSHDGIDRNLVPKYSGILHALKQIYHCEGMKGLYKGVITSMIGQTLARVIFFTTYEIRKEIHSKNKGFGSNYPIILASLEASLMSVILTQPIWIIKTRLQLNIENLKPFQKLTYFTKEIFHQHGITGFYRGMSLSLVLSLHGVIQITVYEKLLGLMKEKVGRDNITQTLGLLFCGMSSKIAASSLLYPLTTIRTRIQQNQFYSIEGQSEKKEKYKNIKDVIEKIWKYEGLKGFYKGFIANALKTVPSKGVFFVFYENLKDVLFGGDHREIRGLY